MSSCCHTFFFILQLFMSCCVTSSAERASQLHSGREVVASNSHNFSLTFFSLHLSYVSSIKNVLWERRTLPVPTVQVPVAHRRSSFVHLYPLHFLDMVGYPSVSFERLFAIIHNNKTKSLTFSFHTSVWPCQRCLSFKVRWRQRLVQSWRRCHPSRVFLLVYGWSQNGRKVADHLLLLEMMVTTIIILVSISFTVPKSLL